MKLNPEYEFLPEEEKNCNYCFFFRGNEKGCVVKGLDQPKKRKADDKPCRSFTHVNPWYEDNVNK